jgi:hypothetical protein
MGLKVVEVMNFGGVDSRSNPINMPANRAIYSKNLLPMEAGFLRLRDGYTRQFTGSGTGAVHSGFSFRLSNGAKYVCYFQGKIPYVRNLSTGAITSPTVRGTAIASSARWSMFFSNARLYAFNGTDKKFFDGSVWRDVGIRPLTSAEVSGVTITDGVRQITASEATTVALSAAAGGSFLAGSVSVYVAFFDTSVDEIGPASISVGAGAVTLTATQKISITGLPNLSTANANWVKLLAGIIGTGNTARLFVSSSISPTAYSRTSNVVTVTRVAHGFSTGDVIVHSSQTDDSYSGVQKITVVDADHYTYASTGSNGTTTGGTAGKCVTVANATTTADILAPTQDSGFNVNEQRGLPTSTILGATPGFQFYASLYNPSTNAVSNRIAIGSRYNPSTSRANVHFTGLPLASSIDSELVLLLGRTGDSAEVPYALSETLNGDWITSSSATAIITAAQIDGNSELPSTRNAQPQAFDKVTWVGNRAYGVSGESATIYKSDSQDDDKTGQFVGEVEQSWSDSTEQFPTGDPVVSVQSFNYEAWFFSLNDLAILSEISSNPGWQGPWYGAGCAGQYAFTKGWKGLPYWITGDKKLATMSPDGPLSISDEYEAALLSKIGDAYLSGTEIVYYREATRRIDQLRIKCLDASGNPFTVIHDFAMRDDRSPYGQGYEEAFLGILAQDYTVFSIRDVNGIQRIWAGASDGTMQQLYTGLNDDGNEFTADQIKLVYLGPYRDVVKQLEWYGDPGVQWFIATELNLAFPSDPFTADKFDKLSDDTPRAVPGDEDAYHYHVDVERPEMIHAYVWMRLVSHSDEAPATGLGLSTPPHFPLEWYGRIYAVDPLMGNPRGK